MSTPHAANDLETSYVLVLQVYEEENTEGVYVTHNDGNVQILQQPQEKKKGFLAVEYAADDDGKSRKGSNRVGEYPSVVSPLNPTGISSF